MKTCKKTPLTSSMAMIEILLSVMLLIETKYNHCLVLLAMFLRIRHIQLAYQENYFYGFSPPFPNINFCDMQEN